MMSDPISLRAEANRLARRAAEAEAAARRQEERRAEMRTDWRIAELLHDEITYEYHGEDPWYYEIPAGADAEDRWKEAWSQPEHVRFIDMANALMKAWFGEEGWPPSPEVVLRTETMLIQLIEVLGSRRAGRMKENQRTHAERDVEYHKKRLLEGVEKELDSMVENLRRSMLR